jgi:hypothetical protein
LCGPEPLGGRRRNRSPERLAHQPPPDAVGEPQREADYGPTLTGTFEVDAGGTNIAYAGVAVRLDPGPGGLDAGLRAV